MKSIVIIILSALFLVSCQSNPSKDYILLTGTISDASQKEFRLYKRKTSPDKKKPTFITITVAEDGSFSSDTITTGTGYYFFSGGSGNSANLYLTNGEAYNFTAVGEKFGNTAKLTGPNAEASNYLLSESAHEERQMGGYTGYEEFISLNESDFIAKQKILYESALSYLDSFPNMPKEFVEKQRQELYYRNILSLTKYESVHRRNTEQPNFKVSPDFIKQFEGVDYANEELYKSNNAYRRMIFMHFDIKANLAKEEEKEENKKYLARLKIFETIPNDYIRNDLVSIAAEYDLGYIDGIDNLEAYYKACLAISTSTENNEIITKKYESLKKLSAGQPSPTFENYVNHAGGTTSLSEFKGKYVYIDVWATWCGPCIREVPFLNEVEKQFHGKNIEFVSVSIDVDFDAWKKMVAEDELFGGVQLIADKQFESNFITGYEVNAIPLFVLIDPDGNIVTRNVPRPSDPSLVDLLKELTI